MKSRWALRALNVGIAAGVFAGAFALYFLTGPSDIAWMEGAEFQRRVALTQIGQGPWEHPLFVFLSQPFLLLPWGELARRANWAAAAFAAGACLFVYLLLKMLLSMAPQFIARRVGVLAALSLAVSHTFWMRAVTPGPEPLDALLLAAILYFLIRFANDGGTRNLYLGMGILGLALANNLLLVFLIPVFFIFVRVVHPPLVRNLGVVRLRGLAVFVAGASLAVAVAAWGWWFGSGLALPEQQKSWLLFWNHMMLAWEQPLQQSLIRYGSMLLLNFPPWTLVIGLIGLVELHRRQKYVFWLLFPLFLVYSSLVVTLELSQPVPSYLPAWLFLSVAVGFGWWKLLSSGGWQGFAFAIVLCASPALIYRFAPVVLKQAKMELRVEALLGAPRELPIDLLAFQLNPDRRKLPQAREFAQRALGSLPEGATVVSPSRTSELMVAPVRYLVEAEGRQPESFVVLDDGGGKTLSSLAADPSSPVFVMGLHPPHPEVEAILSTHLFRATGDWFQLVPRSELPGVFTDAPIAGVAADALSDRNLVGRWVGYAEPQGYPLTLSVQGAEGSLSGTAVLNAEGSRPWSGRFTRLSSTVGAVLGSVEYGESGSDQVHLHIDATQTGNRLEGTWKVFEIPELAGKFVVWQQMESTN